MPPNNVKKIRLEKKISAQKLSYMAEMSATDISLVERGLRPAYPGWRRKLAAALETPESELFPSVIAEAEQPR